MKPQPPISVVHIASGDLWAGAEVQLYTLCKALSRINTISVNVILLNHGMLEDRLHKSNIPVKVLDESRLNGLQIGWQIFKQLNIQKPDVVHTHRLKENIIGGLAAWFNHISSLRTVHGASEHKPVWYKPHMSLLYALNWFTGRYLQSLIIAVSDDLKILLETEYPQEKVRVIENGVDIEALVPYTKKAGEKEASHDRCKIGLVGRLVPVKRVDIFIETAKYMCVNHPELPIQFHVYGDGPLHAQLEQQVRKLDLENTVHFEGHTTDIHKQIASLDALMITSDHEGLPMTLLEAMALGTPVVAHSIGGITKVCDDGKGCMLSRNNTAQHLSEKLLQLLSDPDTYISKIKYAQNYVESKYSASSNATKYQNFYQLLIAR